MNFSVSIAPQSTSVLSNPILLAAILTFSGVLITVVVGTFANFFLAKRRNDFEKALAQEKFLYEKALLAEKSIAEEKARAENRAATLRFRRIDFERSTLLNLQEAMHLLIHNVNRIINIKRNHYNEHGNFSDFAIPEDMEEATRKDYAATSLLIHRIADDLLREDVIDIRLQCIKLKYDNMDMDDFEDLRREMLTAAHDLIHDIGRAIRQLDRDEVNEPTPSQS